MDNPIEHEWLLNMSSKPEFKFNTIRFLFLTWYVPRTTYFFTDEQEFKSEAIGIHITVS
jgi:hypothetical protein